MTANEESRCISSITARGVAVRGDDIDTDRIIPARFLRCVTFEGLGEHAFEDDRKALGGKHPFDDPRFAGAGILVAGSNFGCGSSREHAPQSLMRWGIGGIVGESFAEIFFGNCVSLGIPCVPLSRAEIAAIQDEVERTPSGEITIDIESSEVRTPSATYSATIPSGVRKGFLDGTWDATGLLCAGPDEVARVAASLPYVDGFTDGRD